jgi:hypothetical protein
LENGTHSEAANAICMATSRRFPVAQAIIGM